MKSFPFRVSKAFNVNSMKGHCTGFHVRLYNSTVSFDMLIMAVPAELCSVPEKNSTGTTLSLPTYDDPAHQEIR